MLLFGMSYICLQIFQLIGISHTHFLSYNPKRKRIYSVSALGREQEIVGNEISDSVSDIFYDGFSDVDSGKNAGKKVVVLS